MIGFPWIPISIATKAEGAKPLLRILQQQEKVLNSSNTNSQTCLNHSKALLNFIWP
jgi:hypothetical protein